MTAVASVKASSPSFSISTGSSFSGGEKGFSGISSLGVPRFEAKSSFVPGSMFSSRVFVPYKPTPISPDRHIPNISPFKNTTVLYERPKTPNPTQSSVVATPQEVKKPSVFANTKPIELKKPSLDTHQKTTFTGSEWITTYKNPQITIHPTTRPQSVEQPQAKAIQEAPIQKTELVKALQNIVSVKEQTPQRIDSPKTAQDVLERKVLKQVASLQSVKTEVVQAERTLQSFFSMIDRPIGQMQLTREQARTQVLDALEVNLAKIAKTYIAENNHEESRKKLVALALPKTGKIDLLTSDEYKKIVRDLAKAKALSNVQTRLLALGKVISTEEIEKIVAEKEPLTKDEAKELEERDIYALLLAEDFEGQKLVPMVFKRDDRADGNRLKAFGQAANIAFSLKDQDVTVTGEDITNIVQPSPAIISELALMLGRKDGSLEEIDRDLKQVRGFQTLHAAKRAIVRLIIHKPAVKVEEGKTPNVTNTDVKRVLKEFVVSHTQFA